MSQSQHIDLGNIGSDGQSGRQLHVRELHASEIGRDWVFFPPHLQLPNIFPDPTPPSPAQDSLYLTDEMPLVVVIPQLQHKPTLGLVDTRYRLEGNNKIMIGASLHAGAGVTATIYGPHEFLLPIGQLPTGHYQLAFNLTRTNEFSDAVVTMSGFMDFHVNAVPEPSSLSALFVAQATLVCRCRRRKAQAI